MYQFYIPKKPSNKILPMGLSLKWGFDGSYWVGAANVEYQWENPKDSENKQELLTWLLFWIGFLYCP